MPWLALVDESSRHTLDVSLLGKVPIRCLTAKVGDLPVVTSTPIDIVLGGSCFNGRATRFGDVDELEVLLLGITLLLLALLTTHGGGGGVLLTLLHHVR